LVIGVFSNGDKDIGYSYTEKVLKSIANNGLESCVFRLDKGIEFEGQVEEKARESLESSDIIISIGGDGTLIKAANIAYRNNTPVLGINLGKLGFLTEVEVDNFDNAIKRLAKGDYHVEKRIMLKCVISRGNEYIYTNDALNEFFIAPRYNNHFIKLDIFIEDQFMDSYLGDGIIISTPTGSSAYALSAGGPVVKPDTDIILMVPICPHTIYTRPFVIPSTEIIKIIINETTCDNTAVWGDGYNPISLRVGDCVEIRKSDNFTNIIRLEKINFFKVLRTKIFRREESFVNDEEQKAGETRFNNK
jgi:NAD+ kinase